MAEKPFPPIAFTWPALAAASTEMLSAWAEKFVQLAAPPPSPAIPSKWATPNRIALELASMRLRDFSVDGAGTTTLICAPFALHRATIADFSPGHSLVAALRRAGISRLFVTEWRSATPQMRYLSIDDYLADLLVAVDELGAKVDLIGLCQGGWMALLFAARFPQRIGRLVLAGAPVDIAAGESALSRLVAQMPLSAFQQLVDAGGGRVLGDRMLGLWGPRALDAATACDVLQIPLGAQDRRSLELHAEFQEWFAATVDLPGSYYLQVVELIFKQNRIAQGNFVALGREIDLGRVRTPLFLLAARDDELIATEQLFATERRVGTPASEVEKAVAPCPHLGLFLGKKTLRTIWPRIARWLGARGGARRAAAGLRKELRVEG